MFDISIVQLTIGLICTREHLPMLSYDYHSVRDQSHRDVAICPFSGNTAITRFKRFEGSRLLSAARVNDNLYERRVN